MWLTAFLDFPAESHPLATRFWAAATGTTVSPSRGDHDEFATLIAPDSDDWLRVQRIGGSARTHLDVHGDPSLPDRAAKLGATLLADEIVPVFSSPGGMVFCTVSGDESRPPRPRSWGGHRSLVDQLCLDIPVGIFDGETAFWSGLLGRAAFEVEEYDEFARLESHPGDSLRVLLQRTREGDSVGAHLDLACDDRDAEVARLLSLGAREVRRTPGWTVLVDPAGLEFCVTDRPVED